MRGSHFLQRGPRQTAVPGVGAAGASGAASSTSPHHETFPPHVEASTSSAN